MSLTVSGVITASGTTLSGGTLVSGSHYVNYTYSYIIPSLSGSYVCVDTILPSGAYNPSFAYAFPESHALLYTQEIGEPIGLSPLDLKLGLIAWHPFRETGDYFDDWSDNNYYAINYGTLPILGRQGYGRELDDYVNSYGYVQVPTMPSGLSEYMCSFWIKPTQTLTSGDTNCFTILSSEGFYGDHFEYPYNYVSYSPMRGWYLLNVATTCSAGYDGTYLRLKGAPNTAWSGSTWTSSTLYFKLDKSENWSLDTKIKLDLLVSSQSLGIVLFDRASYTNYCSIVMENKGLEVNERVDLTPAMVSSVLPSGYSVEATSQYYISSYAPYKAFDHVNDSYGWRTESSLTNVPRSIYFGFPSGVYVDTYRFRLSNGEARYYPTVWSLYGMTPWVVEDPDGANNPSEAYATPPMTSDTSPAPYVVSASTGSAPYGAFNQLIAAYTGWWCSDPYSLPAWLKIDMGLGNEKIINKYRFYSNLYQPRDWTVEASNNDSEYVVLQTVVSGVYNPDSWTGWHTFMNNVPYRYYKINVTRSDGGTYNQASIVEWHLVSTTVLPEVASDNNWVLLDTQSGVSSPGAGNWYPWFSIPSPGDFQYYRFKVTGYSGYYLQIGEIELAQLFFIPSPADIKVKTGTFSYIVASDLTMPSSQATMFLKATKTGDIVKFKYKDAYNSYWIEAPQELDCSTWSSGIAFGLQSHNLSGESPEVLFDYVSFQRGTKPDILGDVEVPGRFLITYNETNVSGAVGPRSDSRIWLQSDYKGIAIGTATHYWDPEEWYLLQAGVKSNGDYCWWVNGRQERALVVGSGNTIGTSFLTSAGVNYFDSSFPTSTSGSFILDEVSHWGRWLTGEEILKMINKVSQSQWLYSSGYHSSSINLLSDYISISGSVASRAIPKDLSFYYYGQYQSPSLPSIEIKFQKVSYRIQKDMIIVAQELNPFIVNIARCSSGWMANQMGCFGCLTSSGGNRCQCLVYEEVSMYALGSKNFDYLLYQIPRTQTKYAYAGIVPKDAVSTAYRQLIYDMTGPALASVEPSQNSRLVDSNFEDYTGELGHVTIEDYGSTLGTVDTNRVWIKHSTLGHHSFITSDNFSFYEHDFRTNPSGHGWQSKNPTNTTNFSINSGYSSVVDLNYGEVFASGVHQTVTSSGINSSLQVLKDSSFRFAPTCEVYGTNLLNITTESGSWCPGSTEQSAPYLYFMVPSGLPDWEIKTKLNTYRSGNPVGQYVGLMLWDKNNPLNYYQLLATNSGTAWRSNNSSLSHPPSLYTGLSPTADLWLKYRKSGGEVSCYWSPNGTTWSGINLVTQWTSLVPTMSGFSNPPVYISSSSDATGFQAWKAFDTTITGTWWKGTSGAIGQWLMVDFTEPTVVYAYRFATSPEYFDALGRPLRGWMTGASFQGANNDNGPWTTLHTLTSPTDPGPGGFMPTASGYYLVERPSWYRYYRFYINSSTYVWTQLVCCDISSLQLFGSTTLTISGAKDFYVGPTVVSDRTWVTQTNPIEATVTSWSVSSQNASYPGSKAFLKDSAQYWRAATTSLPQWIQATVSGIAKSYRIYFPNSTCKSWQFQGTNNGITYTTLHTVSGFVYNASYQHNPTNQLFNIDNDTCYTNYRFYITEIQTGYTTAQLSDWRLYYTQSGTSQTLPALTSANFDYVHVSSSSGTGFTQIGDEWELLLEGITPLNSMDSSTYTSFTQVDEQTHRLSYRPLVDYPKGEDIFVRVQSKDPATFKVDYNVTVTTLLYLDCDFVPNIPLDNSLGLVAGSGVLWDKSSYNNEIYSASPLLTTTTASGLSGIGGISISGAGLRTGNISISGGLSEWTFHSFMNLSSGTGFYPLHLTIPNHLYSVQVSGSYLNFYDNSLLTNVVNFSSVTPNVWQHFALTRYQNWINVFYNGNLTDSVFVGSGFSMPSGSLVLGLFDGYYGLADQIVFEKQALWTDTLIKPNYLDEIFTFKTAAEHALNVDFNVSLDSEPPVIIPKSPVPYQQLVCPSSGIEFEIVDDFSGVKWTEVLIQMNDVTVWSGGNNMTEWFDDRGTLVYEDLGKKDGEWANIQLSPSGLEYTDGVNRLLYPPGTVYSGSGAWGRKFTYYVPEPTEIDCFGSRMTITITGTDSVGYLSRFDDKFPNTFSGQYYFDFIPNDNIKFDDVFMHSGHSMRVDEMEARGIHFWVDLYDSDYPATDIVEENCSIGWSDGVNDFTCSGIWFTTWTGVTASGEDVNFHRMHWDPGNHWDWIGNRAIHLTVESHNNNPTCDVYNREEYILFYGWQLGWWHQAVPGAIPPFDFNRKFPIFVSIKTYDFAPSRSSKSYPLWSSPGYTCDLPVYIKPKPIPKKDLKVGILAHSQYLQYSEDVEVVVECQDLDGNVLVYSWSFRTQDAP